MNIETIAKKLNEFLEATSLEGFQRKRSSRLNKECRSLAFFGNRTIHDDYAYHFGGRGELQFNIGIDDPDILRFGIALSIEQDRTITDPVAMFERRFNALSSYLSENAGQYADLNIWREIDGVKHALPKIQALPDTWLSAGSFIFMGGSFSHQSKRNDLTDKQYQEVLDVFEQLLPVYDFVEASANNSDRLRAARIVWNEAGWTRPSGPPGKVKNAKNYEHINGFGHEEWLFDLSKQINGWKYGFLQTFYHHHKAYQGQKFDTLLYSINSSTKNRYWIARVTDLECISTEQADLAVAAFQREGWVDEMKSQVNEVGGNANIFDSETRLEIVNCRFREKDLQVFGNDGLWPELKGDVIRAFYYDTFTKLNPEFFFSLSGSPSQAESFEVPGDLSGYDGSGVKAKTAKHKKRKSDEKHVDLRHKQWQLQMLGMLRERYGNANAGMEVPMGAGSADLLVTHEENSLILEVKTGNSASGIIREAFGQLLEYAYWPGVENEKIALAIIGTPRLDSQSREYIEFIRSKFVIPVSYVRWKPDMPDIRAIIELIEG